MHCRIKVELIVKVITHVSQIKDVNLNITAELTSCKRFNI